MEFSLFKTYTMKFNPLFSIVVIAISLVSCNKPPLNKGQTINPIIGDISYINKFGHTPTATTSEVLRIKTHLEYVELLLRKKDVSHMPSKQQANRIMMLNLLHNYWTQGIFPHNYDYKNQRKPCFIDQKGNICAVGYLVAQTAGRQTAERINVSHQYDEILAMKDNEVNDWIETSGLTQEECAMIQPTYGPPPTLSYNYISPQYGISSSILGGLNLSLNTINTVQLIQGKENKTIPVISLFTGVGSIIYGVYNLPNEPWAGMYAKTNESQKTLSMVNIGLGTMTVVLSFWNLTLKKPMLNKTTAWNIYSFPTSQNQVGMGISWAKRL